jgi:hypothetical protein
MPIYWDELQSAVDKHRKEAFITCADDCWCWTAEAALIENEAANHAKLKEAPTAEKRTNDTHRNI